MKWSLRLTVLLLVVAAQWGGVVCRADDKEAKARVYEAARRASVWVHVPAEGDPAERNGFAFAIDFEADKPVLVTSYHLVGDAEEVKLYLPAIVNGKVVQQREYYLQNETPRLATVIATDSTRDLALLTTWGLPRSVQPLEIADEPPTAQTGAFSIEHDLRLTNLFLDAPLLVTGCGFDVWRGATGGSAAGRLVRHVGGVRATSAGAPLLNREGKLIGVILGPTQKSESRSIAANELKMMLGQQASDDGPEPVQNKPLVGRWLIFEAIGNSESPAGGMIFTPDGQVHTVESGAKPVGTYSLNDDTLTIIEQDGKSTTHEIEWVNDNDFDMSVDDGDGIVNFLRFQPAVRPYFEYTRPVMADWSGDEYWYPGRAYLRRDDKTRIKFLDDDSKEFLRSKQIAVLDLRAGDQVEGNRGLQGSYVPATIVGVEEDRAEILLLTLRYADGEEETAPLRAIRQSRDQVRR